MRVGVCVDMRVDMRTDVRWARAKAPFGESPRRGGQKEYRHASVRALNMPSAMADERL